MGGRSGSERAVEPVAWSWLLVGGATASALLLSVASRYGYHRDELYFLAAGDDLAWGYPDQPPYVALVARATDAVADGSLVALRTPSAITAGLLVVVSGLVAREIGAARAGQAPAARRDRDGSGGAGRRPPSEHHPGGPACVGARHPARASGRRATAGHSSRWARR